MSRDIKSTDITGINDGLDRAINRLHRQMQSEVASSMKEAAEETAAQIASLKEEIQRGYSQSDQETLRQRIEALQEELGARIDTNAQEGNQRMLEFEKSYSQALQEMRGSFYDSMKEQQSRFAGQMQGLQDSLEEQQEQIETLGEGLDLLSQGLQQLDESIGQLQDEIDERFDAQQEQIDTLQKNVTTLFQFRADETIKKKLAAGRALALLETVRKRTLVDRFAPQAQLDKIARLEGRLRTIGSDPSSCTITDVNNLVDETIVMEKEALREQAKWQAKQNQAMTTVNALICRATMKLEVDAESIYEGIKKSKSIILNPDYWTHGKYNILKNRLDEIKKTIESGNADITELDALIREMKELEKKIDCLRKEAANAGILSESRIKMTKDIVKAMQNASWKVKKEDVSFMGGDVDEDEREGTFAILHHPVLGDTLSVIIFPEALQGDEVVNKIVFHRNNETPESEANFQERLRQIKTEIENRTKYHLGELHAPSRGGDGQIEQARSSAELKRKGTAKTMEQLRK